MNSDFLNTILVSCLKHSKKYNPIVFFKDGLMLYFFESLKWKADIQLGKKLEMRDILTSIGLILAVTHFVTQFTHVSRHPKV